MGPCCLPVSTARGTRKVKETREVRWGPWDETGIDRGNGTQVENVQSW